MVEGISDEAKKICVGPGWEPGTQLGPLVSEEQLRRVKGYIDAGLVEGACASTGGKQIGDNGYFVEPTVLINTHKDMKVVREEIFGPVVAAMQYDTLEEVVELSNESSLRPGCRHLDQQSGQGAPTGCGHARGHGLGELLQHL